MNSVNFTRLVSYRHNILLDGALNPYLADFGFLMPLPMESPNNCLFTAAGSIAIAGTRGYLAPEFMAGKIGPKLDVYSYGIVSSAVFKKLQAKCTSVFHSYVHPGLPGDLHWSSSILGRKRK